MGEDCCYVFACIYWEFCIFWYGYPKSLYIKVTI
jgi:hypothetical protein